MKIVTTRWGSENSWRYGTCSGPPSTVKNQVNPCPTTSPQTTCPAAGTVLNLYSSYQATEVECCQDAGTHALTCTDSFGDGWDGGYIEISNTATGSSTGFVPIETSNTKEYCKDFTSGTQHSPICIDLGSSSG